MAQKAGKHSSHMNRSEVAELELLGGDRSLDFANTVDRNRLGETRHEYLLDYHSLVDWARHVGIIDERTEQYLRQCAAKAPTEAEQVFDEALALRRAIQEIFTAIASGAEPVSSDLDLLQTHYLRAIEMASLRSHSEIFDWEPIKDSDRLDQVLWPIVMSAVDLLRYGHVERIKRCPGDDGHCGWLFLDRTKNGSRRWCSMETCGSRDKMRRHYRRTRQGSRKDSVHF